MPYIHFTEDQKLRANSVDLVEFLRRQGEKLICLLYTSRLRVEEMFISFIRRWMRLREQESCGRIR